MPGPTPKPASARQRRNKTATAAQLETTEPVLTEAPELGRHPTGGEWHARTLEFWREVWDSPMADEYLLADRDGLFQLATLVDQFWWDPSAKRAQEIRLQRQCFGLTPIDRRRLQWEIVRAESAKRRKPKRAPEKPTGDPRKALKAI
jgi:hypothetical protein